MTMHFVFLGLMLVLLPACATAPKPTIDPETQRTQNLEEACELDPRSCDRLAFRYLQGIGVEPDPARAAILFQRACKSGISRSCYHLAHLYEKGTGVPQDLETAKRLYRTACDEGINEACNNLAILLKRTGENHAESNALQNKACEGGDGVACFNLGFQAEKSRPPRWEDAQQLYELGCTYKHGESCNYLGVMYRYGFGVEKDISRASTLFISACDFGSLLGCNSAGFAYQKGAGVPTDIAEAARRFEFACNRGLQRACTNLAALAESGFESDVTPFERYKDACGKGDGKGCSRLGVLYLGGKHGAPKDLKKARAAFENSCDRRYAAGCSNLGVVYEEGYGLEAPLYDDAKEKYELACRLGEPKGCHNLGFMIADGVGAPPDVNASADHFMKACESDYLESCAFLGNKWLQMRGKEDLGRRLLDRACVGGHKDACIEAPTE